MRFNCVLDYEIKSLKEEVEKLKQASKKKDNYIKKTKLEDIYDYDMGSIFYRLFRILKLQEELEQGVKK